MLIWISIAALLIAIVSARLFNFSFTRSIRWIARQFLSEEELNQEDSPDRKSSVALLVYEDTTFGFVLLLWGIAFLLALYYIYLRITLL